MGVSMDAAKQIAIQRYAIMDAYRRDTEGIGLVPLIDWIRSGGGGGKKKIKKDNKKGIRTIKLKKKKIK